jgi:hypothetical protein
LRDHLSSVSVAPAGQAVSLTVDTARHPKKLPNSATPNVERSHRFAWALGGIVVIGIVARILFIVGWTWRAPAYGDPLFFQQSAAHIAHGDDYVNGLLGGPLAATALHPPAFSVLLAGLDLIHLRSLDAHRLALAFISAGGVLAMGLFGRRLAGPRVGLLAAGLAAIGPLWIQQGGFLMSESLYLVVVPMMLLFALRCMDRSNPWDFLALGALVGLATLTRSEAVDFVLLLGLFVVVLSSGRWRARLVFAAVFLAGVSLLVVPWVVRNDTELGSLTLSTNSGFTLSGAYSATTLSPDNPYYGSFDNNSLIGITAIIEAYTKPPNHAHHWTEVTLSDAERSEATNVARRHLSDLPGVVLAREGRAWGVYAPGTQLAYDVSEDDTGARGPKQVGQILNWVLLPFAFLGAIQLARRSRPRFAVVVVPIAVVAINAAVFYGTTRLRMAAEPSIDVLASIGVLWVGGRIVHRPRAESVSSASEISNC